MTYVPHYRAFAPSLVRKPAAASRAGAILGRLLRRAFDSIYESRRRHAEREIARYLERTGGRFTDDVERQITNRLVTGDWRR